MAWTPKFSNPLRRYRSQSTGDEAGSNVVLIVIVAFLVVIFVVMSRSCEMTR